jgi:hypothetical protein
MIRLRSWNRLGFWYELDPGSGDFRSHFSPLARWTKKLEGVASVEKVDGVGRTLFSVYRDDTGVFLQLGVQRWSLDSTDLRLSFDLDLRQAAGVFTVQREDNVEYSCVCRYRWKTFVARLDVTYDDLDLWYDFFPAAVSQLKLPYQGEVWQVPERD